MTDEEAAPSSGRKIAIVVGSILALMLFGCLACGGLLTFWASRALPNTDAAEAPTQPAENYYGHWTGQGVDLVVFPDSVSYITSEGVQVRYSGAFEGISGQNIRINAGLAHVNLVVSSPPHEDSGGWVMVIEGREVRRLVESGN